ncbi:MAG: PEGA domain-containing protein [Myxococcales bacterium]|nr:PEGA domain-containing protein [Myxococcota bacterium]MDW8282608.1 PEGA domain-containing protein [Myxococcales bacterium]
MPTSIRVSGRLVLPLAVCAVVLPGAFAWGQATGPRVIIDSSPPGATVYIDGKERGVQGYAGPDFKIRLSRGPHRVLLEMEGYKPVEQVINVTQAQKFTFTLERAPARLEIKTPGTNETARGGEVFIDGAPAGTVPVPVEVPSGRHLVEVRKPGYRVFSETVELKAGDVRTLWVTLQSEIKAGSLIVAADAAAEVFVDGQPRGQAPVLVDNLPEGDHVVEVRRLEPGSPPWRQTVRVTAGQQSRVLAQTQSGAPQTGSLLVLTAVPDAEVSVDGQPRGRANQEIGGLKPGQHIVEVRAKGHSPVTKVIDVEAGKQRVERIDLQQTAESRGMGILRVIMVNPVEGAQYFINGRKYDEAVILGDRGVEIPSGPAIVVVRREGYGEVRKDVMVRPGTVETVTIDLRNVGKLLVGSEPRGAEVLINNAIVGRTPYTAEELAAGSYLVEVRLPDYQPFVQQVTVRGGEQATLHAQLVRLEARPPTVDDATRRRGQSSFSAVTIDPGGFTADVGVGYPYFVNLRLTVGAARRSMFGLDVGAELRTTFYETDVGVNLRAQVLKTGPIALGGSMFIGGGGGPRGRNSFVFEVGVPLTLLAGNLVRLTVRPYLQVYSDQLCPTYERIRELVAKNDLAAIVTLVQPEHIGDRCTGGGDENAGIPRRYRNAIAEAAGYYIDRMGNPRIDGMPTYDPSLIDFQEDGNPVLSRFSGARFMLQAVVEIAITQMTNIWLLIEGAPFQKDRQQYTDKFNRIFPHNDFPLYGRAGFTIKF